MASRSVHATCLSTLLALAHLNSSYLLSQTSGTLQPLPSHSATSWTAAENRWRLSPVDLQLQNDSVAPDIRAARTPLWQPVLQSYKDMEANGRSIAFTDGVPPFLEIAPQPEALWLIATFDHYLVVSIDPDYQLLYTEVSFKVEQVIRNSKTVSFSPGMMFDVDIMGGRVKTPNGDLVSRLLVPQARSPQPGRNYLIKILPAGAGSWLFQQRWDISSGKVAEHNSVLSGKTTSEAVSYLELVLPIYKPE